MRPKWGSGCSVATNPYAPSATMPAPMQAQPRCSRTPCQTSKAPPISAAAARTNRSMERATVMPACSHPNRGHRQWHGSADGVGKRCGEALEQPVVGACVVWVELGKRDRDQTGTGGEHGQCPQHLVELQPRVPGRVLRQWGIGEVDDVDVKMDDILLGAAREELERPAG